MKIADLHIHSSYSDGFFSPEEIVEKSRLKGLKYISITDHDNISSQYITKNKYDDICIIPGAEFSTEYKDSELHILAYYIDVDDFVLNMKVSKIQQMRVERSREIIKRLKKQQIFLNEEDVISHNGYSTGRGNIAKAMVKAGYAESFKEAFVKYLIKGKEAYVDGKKQNYKDTLEMITSAGGIPVLAHPGKIYRNIEVESIIRELKCYGLKGLEVYHPSHNINQINNFYNLSRKYKLVVTGGSDFHGSKETEPNLGAQGVNELLVKKLIEYKQKF